MAGKRLLDAALVLNATRNIARQHIRIRREQLDVWSQTSSIAKAVQSQTERVTLTAQAAAAIVRRLNEQPPSPSEFVNKARRADADEGIPKREAVDHSNTDHTRREGLQQDHHYGRSEQNATQEPPPLGWREVTQERPLRTPTPDGSIPPVGAPVDVKEPPAVPPGLDSERVVVPPKKEPLEQQQLLGSTDLKPASASETTIPDPGLTQERPIPQREVVPEQDEVPEGVNTDVFHTPRVKRMLGNKGAESKLGIDLPLSGLKPAPVEKRPQVDGEDQETFTTRMATAEPVQEAQSQSVSANASPNPQTDESMHALAADMAQEQQQKVSQVRVSDLQN